MFGLDHQRIILIDEYSRKYFDKLSKLGVGGSAIQEIEDIFPIINIIMEFYRLGIFARLAKVHGLNQQDVELRLNLLDETHDGLVKML